MRRGGSFEAARSFVRTLRATTFWVRGEGSQGCGEGGYLVDGGDAFVCAGATGVCALVAVLDEAGLLKGVEQFRLGRQRLDDAASYLNSLVGVLLRRKAMVVPPNVRQPKSYFSHKVLAEVEFPFALCFRHKLTSKSKYTLETSRISFDVSVHFSAKRWR